MNHATGLAFPLPTPPILFPLDAKVSLKRGNYDGRGELSDLKVDVHQNERYAVYRTEQLQHVSIILFIHGAAKHQQMQVGYAGCPGYNLGNLPWRFLPLRAVYDGNMYELL